MEDLSAKETRNLNLGDLEFKAEDFKSIKMPMTNGKITTDIVRLDEMIKYANQILKERLEKAPLMYCRDPRLWAADQHPGFARATHLGRLVCIEELK